MSESASGEATGSSTASDKVFSCESCDYTTGKSSSLTAHQRRCCPNRLEECPTCENLFLNDRGVEIHHARSHGESLSKIQIECPACGDTNSVYRHRKDTYDNHFCNRDCKSEYQSTQGGKDHPLTKQVEVECAWCGKEDTDMPSYVSEDKNWFCDFDCYGEYRSENYTGEDNPRWRGGAPNHYGEDWPKMRVRALEKYDYECAICGKSKDELGMNPDVHHIMPVREFENPDDANTIDNLIVLCRQHHKRWEGLYLKPQLV